MLLEERKKNKKMTKRVKETLQSVEVYVERSKRELERRSMMAPVGGEDRKLLLEEATRLREELKGCIDDNMVLRKKLEFYEKFTALQVTGTTDTNQFRVKNCSTSSNHPCRSFCWMF